MDFLRDAPETTGDEVEETEVSVPKIYESVPSFSALSERLALFLQQYNESVRGTAMDLVFFKVSSRFPELASCGGKTPALTKTYEPNSSLKVFLISF